MVEPAAAGEILKRALGYPYPTPSRSFVQVGERALDLPAEGPDLSGRTPLLAYGANAAPAALARKLAPLPGQELPLLRAELEGFDVVYSAHISPYGAVPGTLRRSPGTVVTVFVAYATEDQRQLLSATEPNYEPASLGGVSCRLETGGAVAELDAYVSRHGCLAVGGTEVALAAVPASARRLPQMTQRSVLERVRAALAPGLSLEEFVATCLEPGLSRSRTEALAATANPGVLV